MSTQHAHGLSGARTFPPSYGSEADRRIVVAVDSSAAAYAALRWALLQAVTEGCTVLAVTVLDPRRRADWRLERDPAAALHEQQDRLGGRVARAMTEHELTTGQPAPPVQVLVVRGELVPELAALTGDTGLLVAGRPQTGMSEEAVRDLAGRCPVLLVDEYGETSHPG
jgi:nucleotide-binding universal stress UspA family protein